MEASGKRLVPLPKRERPGLAAGIMPKPSGHGLLLCVSVSVCLTSFGSESSEPYSRILLASLFADSIRVSIMSRVIFAGLCLTPFGSRHAGQDLSTAGIG